MMKYKVRLLEKRFKEVTYLSTIKRYLSDPDMMKKLISNPDNILDYSVVNSKGKTLPISSKKDIILALSNEKLIPTNVLDILNTIKKDGYSGSSGRLPPAVTVDKTIDIFLSKYPLYASFLDLFVPDSGAGTKPPEDIVSSYEKNKDDPTKGRKDIFDRA